MEDEKILHFVLAIFKMMLYNTPVTSVDVLNNAFTLAGVMELVDVVDSKSTAGDSVPVRVRPPAPKTSQPPSGVGMFLIPVSVELEFIRVRGATRPPPVAESREGSEWQRSVCNAAAPTARRTPHHRNRTPGTTIPTLI